MSLSPRQLRVVEALVEGLDPKEIARRDGLTVKTVETYIATAAQQVGGRGRPMNRLIVWWFTRRTAPT